MQKVAAYCRVSTDKEEQAQSLINQKRYFDEYIRRHADWNLVNVYFDEGTSGTQTRKREGFNRMIGDALSGQIDLILTKEVSRFARNTVDALAYTRMLRERRIGVIFILDNIDTRDCDGELRLTLMASLAQEESRKISERIKWGQRRRMEQGVVFGRDLLGYTVRGGQLFINEAEAAVVRRIYHKYTDEGKSAGPDRRRTFWRKAIRLSMPPAGRRASSSKSSATKSMPAIFARKKPIPRIISPIKSGPITERKT